MRTTLWLTLRNWVVLGSVIMTLASIESRGEEQAAGLPKVLKKLSENQPVKIVCLGDSVTGIYYHTGGRRAYPEMLGVALAKVYPEGKITVVNAGISGNSTVNGLKRLQKDVLDQRPDLVTVMFGLNDMVRVSLEDFKTNLKSIIEQCRGVGAEVLLCTPNGIIDTSGRPVAKLQMFMQAMKEVGEKLQVPVCDVYAAYNRLRPSHPIGWRLLLSDEIHPNMDGHKLNAVELCRAITGKLSTLKEAGPPQPAMQRTLAKLKAGAPIRVLAMSPVDSLIGPALQTVAPGAKVEVAAWPTADQTLAQLEQAAAKIRATQSSYDLVIVAVPLNVTPVRGAPEEAGIKSYTWILNHALSFGLQEWDVVGVTPSLFKADLTEAEQKQDDFARQIILAQDLSVISRDVMAKDSATPQQVVEAWLRMQLSQK